MRPGGVILHHVPITGLLILLQHPALAVQRAQKGLIVRICQRPWLRQVLQRQRDLALQLDELAVAGQIAEKAHGQPDRRHGAAQQGGIAHRRDGQPEQSKHHGADAKAQRHDQQGGVPVPEVAEEQLHLRTFFLRGTSNSGVIRSASAASSSGSSGGATSRGLAPG